MRPNVYAFAGILWIATISIVSIGYVGKMTCATPYAFDWSIVPMMGLWVAFPFGLGFLAGRHQ